MPTRIRPVADNPIFILGPHKSGTSLLRSLFDGHPELFAIPTECHFFWHAHRWIEYPFRKSKPPLKTSIELRNSFFNWIELGNRYEDKYGDMLTKGLWDLERLKTVLFENRADQETLRQEIDRFVNSMWFALQNGASGHTLETVRFVEKSVENMELAPLINRIYPEAKFLHIVRNPYANFVSFRKYKSRYNKYPFIIPLLKSILLSFYHLFRNQEILNSYHIVKYEELVQRPQETIQKVCNWCDLPYDERLLKPTLLGKSWTGNSVYHEPYSDLSTKSLNRWKSEIFDFEIYAINKTLGTIMDDFGYERISHKKKYTWPLKFLWPMRKEPVNTYIKNRYFMRYSGTIL